MFFSFRYFQRWFLLFSGAKLAIPNQETCLYLKILTHKFLILRFLDYLCVVLEIVMKRTLLFPEYIFESSWEVCNKVGGIYTVLSSRALTLQKELGDNLIFIGPDFGEDTPSLKRVLSYLKTKADSYRSLLYYSNWRG